MLEHFKTHHADLQFDRKLAIAKTMASQLAVKAMTPLHEKEMQNLADQNAAAAKEKPAATPAAKSGKAAPPAPAPEPAAQEEEEDLPFTMGGLDDI